MKLKKLLKELPGLQVKGSKEAAITGISANSKLIFPGNLFIAKRGRVHDGQHYIPEAVASGAIAVITDIFDPFLKGVVQVIHSNPAEIEGLLAARYYEQPSKELFMVGITGTNGKTTTCYLVRHLLQQMDVPCGLIGTIEYLIGDNHYTATRTTPDVVANHKMLREMELAGCQAGVMETTSHALDQGRLAEIDFDVAVYTNLSLDHLDYHGTMEEYAAAKSLLFQGLKSTATVVSNADDPWQERVLGNTKANVLTYGIRNSADLTASDLHLSATGTQCTLTYQQATARLDWPGVGRYNMYNALAAIGVALTKGASLQDAADHLTKFPGVRGRLEFVSNRLNLKVFVDYCHTDDALKNVLATLAEFKTGRVITVFGCGGDRDKSKRPKMAQVAERYSDLTIITSDNPRSEDPQMICNQVLAGFEDLNSVMIRQDRRLAIRRALELATPEDTIVIAGKGHETTQVFSHETIAFDDREVVKEICDALHEETTPR